MAPNITVPPNMSSNNLVASSLEEDEEMAPMVSSANGSSYGAVMDDGTSNDLAKESLKDVRQIKRRESSRTLKTRSSFWEDARDFAEGTIPQSLVMALAIGTVCGIAAYIYYACLWALLEYVWHTLPQQYVIDVWPEWSHVLWIPLVGFTMAIGVGLSVVLLGEPGDLPYTIKCVHDKAYIEMSHVLPMVAASQFSILGGGSYGPEAPLVAVCAALGGFVSRRVFHQTNRNIVRKHTLMGMSGALAAFFGSPLGGSLFALEVCGRFGVEYFEHMVEAIFAGVVCLVVFRGLSGMPIGAIWDIADPKLDHASSVLVLVGCGLGLVGALIAFMFAGMHWRVFGMFERLDLLRNERAVQRALLGCIVIVGVGMFVPHTMFWGEFEFETIATLSPASTLEHVWPTSGLIGFEMDAWWKCLLVGFLKIVCISFTVCGGYRGGFIFPFFAAGAAFGRAITFLFPSIPVSVATLCVAAGINVAITRTSLATSLILVYLAGDQMALAPVLAASLVSLFVTGYMPFIKTQIARSDIDSSLYHNEEEEPCIEQADIEHGGLNGIFLSIRGRDVPSPPISCS